MGRRWAWFMAVGLVLVTVWFCEPHVIVARAVASVGLAQVPWTAKNIERGTERGFLIDDAYVRFRDTSSHIEAWKKGSRGMAGAKVIRFEEMRPGTVAYLVTSNDGLRTATVGINLQEGWVAVYVNLADEVPVTKRDGKRRL